MKKFLLFLVMFTFLAGCGSNQNHHEEISIAVTNSYIACAVRDFCGENVNVICLTPPGMCPGHFDISPGQVQQLRKCRVMLRFDFQSSLDKRFSPLTGRGMQIAPVPAPDGLCIPENYLSLCSNICKVLSQIWPEHAEKYQQRLKQIRLRIENLGQKLQKKMVAEKIKGNKTISSAHQTVFAEWLGLDVVAEFTAQDIATPANINTCLRIGRENNVKIIIANAQQGVRLAESMGNSLDSEVVVFSNFPEKEQTFDELIQKNVAMLIQKANL